MRLYDLILLIIASIALDWVIYRKVNRFHIKHKEIIEQLICASLTRQERKIDDFKEEIRKRIDELKEWYNIERMQGSNITKKR